MRLLALATLVGFVTNALAVSVPLFETDVVSSSPSDSAELGPGNSTDANSLDALAGLRCSWEKDNPWCGGNCSTINELAGLAQSIPNDGIYEDHWAFNPIACKTCNTTAENGVQGLCVSLRNMGGKSVAGYVIKEKLHRLQTKGCRYCGACPVYPGNNGNKGEIVVQYEIGGCRRGVGGPKNGPCWPRK